MQILPPSTRIGDRVIVRGQRWFITDLHLHAECAVVSLRGFGASNSGLERQVVAPFDKIEPILERYSSRRVGIHQWRHECRRVVAQHGTACALHSAATASIEVLPHQLEPALAIVSGLGSRVLIADDVGLGKTIQAGLILAELQRRGAAERTLIVTPSGLREQWSNELRTRFGIDAAIADAQYTRRFSAMLPIGSNPWAVMPIVVVSIDYIKRPEVLPAITSPFWDLVIVDEAHNAAGQSERHDAVDAICRRAAAVVLLTATPHNGDTESFASLCRIGERDDRLLVFRRTRQHIALGGRRRVHHLLVRPTRAEKRMHQLLADVARAVGRGRSDAAWLIVAVLQKRAMSSAHSLARSLARRIAQLQADPGASQDSASQLLLPLTSGDGELDSSDDEPAWTNALVDDPAAELRMLLPLERAAQHAAQSESKLRVLLRLLRCIVRRDERAVVFTEYRDTLAHVQAALRQSEAGWEVAALHGGLSRSGRRDALRAFMQGDAQILLTTDTGGEGLNLHHRCRIVINLELPWNPMRLEQRIGRVDRIGQPRTVHAFHLITRDCEEAQILARLHVKVARARRDALAADPLSPAATHDDAAVSRWLADAGELGDVARPRSPCPLENLAEPAVAEGQRLSLARLMSVSRSEHFSTLWRPGGRWMAQGRGTSGTLIARTRRSRVRQRLGTRSLSVIESVWEDECGRAIASHVGGVLHPSDALQPDVAALRHCPDDYVVSHQRFWQIRLDRLRAIASSVPKPSPTPSQSGLFDRRAELEAARCADTDAEGTAALSQRVAEASRSLAVYRQPPRVVLRLEP